MAKKAGTPEANNPKSTKADAPAAKAPAQAQAQAPVQAQVPAQAAASAPTPGVIKIDDSSPEARLFGIMEQLFTDMENKKQGIMGRIGNLDISTPNGKLSLSKDNIEKLYVLHTVYHKLLEGKNGELQAQYHKDYSHRIGKLIELATKEQIDISDLVKDIYSKLSPQQPQQPASR